MKQSTTQTMMTKAEFMRYLETTPKFKANNFEYVKIKELIEALNDDLLEKVAFNISFDKSQRLQRDYLTLKTLTQIIKDEMFAVALKRAENGKIITKDGFDYPSRLDEKEKITTYLYRLSVKSLPEWAWGIKR